MLGEAMAVDDQDVIDIVGIDGSDKVVLTIPDHLDWLDPAADGVLFLEPRVRQ